MTRSILSGMLGLISVLAVGALPLACQSGGVGDPCVPEDEYNAGDKDNAGFAGFKVTEENIESRSFQCQTRICLVNHFQGRVSCPFGQSKPASVEVDATECQNEESTEVVDDPNTPANELELEKAKPCCVPGTKQIVNAEICGQCSTTSKRDAVQGVYCSCRCDVADGQPADPNFNFCECPTGFTCSQIRPFVGLGDANLSGKYCIKEGTEFKNEGDCGSVQGHFNATQCKGIGASAAEP